MFATTTGNTLIGLHVFSIALVPSKFVEMTIADGIAVNDDTMVIFNNPKTERRPSTSINKKDKESSAILPVFDDAKGS